MWRHLPFLLLWVFSCLQRLRPAAGRLKLEELNPTPCAGSAGTDSRGQLWCKLTPSWPVPSLLSGSLNKRKSEPVPCCARSGVGTCGPAAGALCRGSLLRGKVVAGEKMFSLFGSLGSTSAGTRPLSWRVLPL